MSITEEIIRGQMEGRGHVSVKRQVYDNDKDYAKRISDANQEIEGWIAKLIETGEQYEFNYRRMVVASKKGIKGTEHKFYAKVEFLLDREGMNLRKKLNIWIPDPLPPAFKNKPRGVQRAKKKKYQEALAQSSNAQES